MVSRDRCGLYAQGGAQGSPQAQQTADRFHLLQNLRAGHRTAASAGPSLRALRLSLAGRSTFLNHPVSFIAMDDPR